MTSQLTFYETINIDNPRLPRNGPLSDSPMGFAVDLGCGPGLGYTQLILGAGRVEESPCPEGTGLITCLRDGRDLPRPAR